MAGYYLSPNPLNNEGRSLIARRTFDANNYRDPTFFPLQAQQIADAEAPQPAPQQASTGSIPRTYADFQKAHDAANAANEQRYSDTLQAYDDRTAKAMSYILPDPSKAGFTMSPIDYYESQHPGDKFSRDDRFRVANLYAGLSAEKPRVMESRNDEGPDPNLLAKLEQERGAGSTEGMEAPMGAPVMGIPQGGDYGQPQMEQEQYGQPQMEQEQYGQPQMAQEQYGQPQAVPGRSSYGVPGGQVGPAAPPQLSNDQRLQQIYKTGRDKQAATEAAAAAAAAAAYNAKTRPAPQQPAAPPAPQLAAPPQPYTTPGHPDYPAGYAYDGSGWVKKPPLLSARSVAQRTIAQRKAPSYAAD